MFKYFEYFFLWVVKSAKLVFFFNINIIINTY